MQRLIERRGHHVVAVGSTEEAEKGVRVATLRFPHSRLDAPRKEGVDLCRAVRAQERGDDVHPAVTARGETEDLQSALEAGANDYLTKPLDLGLLNVSLSVAERQIRDLRAQSGARCFAEICADLGSDSGEYNRRILCGGSGFEVYTPQPRYSIVKGRRGDHL